MNKEEYNKYEEIINKLEINKDKYIVYMWNDISGFDYWSDKDNGANYIMVTIGIDPLSYFSKKTIKSIANDLNELVDKLNDEFYMNDLEKFLCDTNGIYETLHK